MAHFTDQFVFQVQIPQDDIVPIESISTLPPDAVQRCQEVFQVTPKDLQLKVAEFIGGGQDCILIAGCGWGKTLVYFLPLVLWTTRVIVIISPLKAIMQEQRMKLQSLGISSISFEKDVPTGNNVIRDVAGGKYRAVFLTPEMIFKSKALTPLWSNKSWKRRLQAVVLDEAHCVSTWGPEFREDYYRIGEL
ncbi:ATP-dependent DNA helicase Q4, partial [Mortierella polycephala]